jgi:hypothetical protein
MIKKYELEIERRLERCRDCICLVAGRNGEWICDEAERPCSEVEHCPEGLGEVEKC